MIKNIYDIAGNLFECTTEVTDRNNSVLCVGGTDTDSGRRFVAYRHDNTSAITTR